MSINKEMGAEEMAQQPLVLTAPLSSVPSTHDMAHNHYQLQPQGIRSPFLASPSTCTYVLITHTHLQKIEKWLSYDQQLRKGVL